MLNIEIKDDASAVNSTQEVNTSTAVANVSTTVDAHVHSHHFDISLYNEQGTKIRHTTAKKGGKTHFNVAHLKAGNYYLHIYDKTTGKSERQQIVVKH